MAILVAIVPNYNGLLLGAVAAAAGDKFLNTGNELIYIKNGSGAPITLTLDTQSVIGLPITDPIITVAAAAEKIVGPFDPRFFSDSNGFLNLTYSLITSVTIAIIQKN